MKLDTWYYYDNYFIGIRIDSDTPKFVETTLDNIKHLKHYLVEVKDKNKIKIL